MPATEWYYYTTIQSATSGNAHNRYDGAKHARSRPMRAAIEGRPHPHPSCQVSRGHHQFRPRRHLRTLWRRVTTHACSPYKDHNPPDTPRLEPRRRYRSEDVAGVHLPSATVRPPQPQVQPPRRRESREASGALQSSASAPRVRAPYGRHRSAAATSSHRSACARRRARPPPQCCCRRRPRPGVRPKSPSPCR